MSYKEEFRHITTFIFDVDGVFTDGSITILPDGEMIRTMNTKDGYAGQGNWQFPQRDDDDYIEMPSASFLKGSLFKLKEACPFF